MPLNDPASNPSPCLRFTWNGSEGKFGPPSHPGKVESLSLFLQRVQSTVIVLRVGLEEFLARKNLSLLRKRSAGSTSTLAEDRCSVMGAKGSGKTSVRITDCHSVRELIPRS